MRRRSVAVILAGGTGERVGLSIPKQLIKVAGKPVMEHTIEVFQRSNHIDEIIILMHPDHMDAARAIAKKFPKVTQIVPGGETRNASTHNALAALADHPDDTKVMSHDAVRPLLDPRIITELLEALDHFNAVDVAISSADTIVEVDDNRQIVNVPPRPHMWRGQTPQAFRLSTLREAYDLAWQDPDFSATDDCTVVLKYLPGEPITVVEGAERNMKITRPIDVFLADKLFQLGSATAPEGHDKKRWYRKKLAGMVIVILGASYGIGEDIAKRAAKFGAVVHAFGRSTTGTDVRNPDDIAAALNAANEASGRIDAVILTAGMLSIGDLAETPPETVAEMIDINYVAPVNVARLAFPYLRASKGHLVMFTSSSYTRGRAGYALYSSAKAAVVNLTQALADEWSRDKVRVNCMNPGRTHTPMRTEAFGPEEPTSLLSSRHVARATIDVLLSKLTGFVVDVRIDSLDAWSDATG